MEDKLTKSTFTIAVIALLVGLGVPVSENIFNNELNDYYICEVTTKLNEFAGGISGTAYSGYPFSDSRKGAVYCGTSDNKGSWIKLSVYAAENNIDPYDLMPQDKNTETSTASGVWGEQYIVKQGKDPIKI